MPLPTSLRILSHAASLLAAAASAQAADFATTHRGTIGAGTNIPGAIPGQRYALTLVMNNDGSDARNQSWSQWHLVCALWHLNDAGDRVLAFKLNDLGAGTLTSFFASADSSTNNASYFNTNVAALALPMVWGSANPVLNDGTSQVLHDAQTGGISMASAAWSAPRAFTDACDASAPPPPAPAPAPSYMAVPTLGEWGVLLLTMGLGLLGLQHSPIQRHQLSKQE